MRLCCGVKLVSPPQAVACLACLQAAFLQLPANSYKSGHVCLFIFSFSSKSSHHPLTFKKQLNIKDCALLISNVIRLGSGYLDSHSVKCELLFSCLRTVHILHLHLSACCETDQIHCQPSVLLVINYYTQICFLFLKIPVCLSCILKIFVDIKAFSKLNFQFKANIRMKMHLTSQNVCCLLSNSHMQNMASRHGSFVIF